MPFDSSDEASFEGYKEELLKVETIEGTTLSSGCAYRLYHKSIGKAPVLAYHVEDYLVNALHYYGPYRPPGLQGFKWELFPLFLVAERRQSEWSKYE